MSISRSDRTGTNGGLPVTLRVVTRLSTTHPQGGHSFATSTHLHGSASLPRYGGHAGDPTAPGRYKDYRYPDRHQDAGTLWYHDHAVHGRAARHLLQRRFRVLNASTVRSCRLHLSDDPELAAIGTDGAFPTTRSTTTVGRTGVGGSKDARTSGRTGRIGL